MAFAAAIFTPSMAAKVHRICYASSDYFLIDVMLYLLNAVGCAFGTAFGHECVGEVVALGSDVTDISIGDRSVFHIRCVATYMKRYKFILDVPCPFQ